MSYTVHGDGFESTGDVASVVGGLFAFLGIPVDYEATNRAARRRRNKLARGKKPAKRFTNV